MPHSYDFEPLSSLTNLATLGVTDECFWFESFWRPFQNIASLNRVLSHYSRYRDAARRHASLMPKTVRALEAQDYEERTLFEPGTSPPAEVARLRDLKITLTGEAVVQLSHLTLLEHLRLTVRLDWMGSLDDVLPHLSLMQTLDIKLSHLHEFRWLNYHYGRLSLSGSSLEGMAELRALSLECVDVDDQLFHHLASKERLTKLEFVGAEYMNYTRSFLSQVNQLTGLLELRLEMWHSCNVCRVLCPRRLSKLKRLDVSGTEEQLVSLRNRFANMKVLINPEESPWCSRLDTSSWIPSLADDDHDFFRGYEECY